MIAYRDVAPAGYPTRLTPEPEAGVPLGIQETQSSSRQVPEQDVCLGSQASRSLVTPGAFEVTCHRLSFLRLVAHQSFRLAVAENPPFDLSVAKTGN